MTMPRRLAAEGIGSMLLTATVVGSGVMAQSLAAGNEAVALLANTGATVAVLAVLIALLGPTSGAHFNPVVSLAMALTKRREWPEMGAYAATQFAAAVAGTLLAHAMFALPLIQVASHARTGAALWLSELVATAGLLLVVLGHRRASDAPWMVASWIGAAYWFTASTSFANPAMAVARSMSDTFAGMRPMDVPGFVVAEVSGMFFAISLAKILFQPASLRRS